jgi:hypothetical protein
VDDSGTAKGNEMSIRERFQERMRQRAPQQRETPTPAMPREPRVPADLDQIDPYGQGINRVGPQFVDPSLFEKESRFDDARAYQVADASGNFMLEDSPPSVDQLAQMGQRVGIDPQTLQGLDLNATESRNFGYLLRMMEAENEIRRLQDSNTLGQRMLELLPGQDIEALFMDPEYRRYMLARENFNEAALRAATGATINQQEMPMQRRNYFPLPTDDAETRALLERQRQALMMALTAGSGAAAQVIPNYGEPVVPKAGEISTEDQEFLKSLGIN